MKNEKIVSAFELARQVILQFEQTAGEPIVEVSFQNSENSTTNHRVEINGVIDIRLTLHYKYITPALFSIRLSVHDRKWEVKSSTYLQTMCTTYWRANTSRDYTFTELRKWADDFVMTIYQLKSVEVHGIIAD